MPQPDHLDAASLLTSLPDAIVVISPRGAVRWASTSAIQLFGDGDLRGLTLSIERVHPADRAEVFGWVQRIRSGEKQLVRAAWRLRQADGSWQWLDTFLRDARKDPNIGGFVLSARQTDRSEQEDHSGSVSASVRFAADGYWEWDIANDLMDLSPEWLSTVGWLDTDHRFTSAEWFESVHLDDRERLRLAIRGALTGTTDRLRSEHRLLAGDGTWRWVQIRGVVTRDQPGRAISVAGTLSDVSESKLTDLTTGLANALLFKDRLSQMFASGVRDPVPFGVLVLDIDRHAVVRESLGHTAGDEMLRSIALRLQRTLRPGDTVARIGEARFGVLLDSLRDNADASRVGERLHEALTDPIRVGEQDVYTSASVGIALIGPSIESPEDLLRAAETAMRRARESAEDRFAYFDGDMHKQAKERLELETDLRRAIVDEAFELHYQPIVELADGSIVGFEALVRWRNEARGGLVPPGLFIPISEETGLIVQIGRWVLGEAVRQLHTWMADFPDAAHMVISVNVSAREFDQADLAQRVLATLKAVGLAPHQLKLEVTETAIMGNPTLAAATLHKLKAEGVKLALDDFGTGYSSLGYLHQMPFDDIKIDRSFVSKIDDDGTTPVIVTAIVSLAASLGMACVAEGIETPEQERVLRGLGCRFGQGWHFGRPQPAALAQEWLLRRAG